MTYIVSGEALNSTHSLIQSFMAMQISAVKCQNDWRRGFCTVFWLVKLVVQHNATPPCRHFVNVVAVRVMLLCLCVVHVKQEQELQRLRDFISSKKPHVIAVGAHSR